MNNRIRTMIVAGKSITRRILAAMTLMLIALSAHAGGYGSLVGAMAGRFDSYGSGRDREQKQIDDVLIEVSKYLNKHMPQELDNNTWLDHVGAGPGSRFSYYYKLSYRRDSAINKSDIFNNAMGRLKKTLCAGTRNRIFLSQGVTLSYVFSGTDGQEIGEVKFPPNSCMSEDKEGLTNH